MKFIGLRLCEHDSNITYTNGRDVKYYKSERDLQIKHHGYDDLSSWTKVIKNWNINPHEVNAIGIVLDYFRHPHLKCDESKIFETIDIPLFSLMGFIPPIFRIDHHYAHMLSVWPLDVDYEKAFIFDGFGDDKISHSLFAKDEKILEYRYDEYESFGRIMGMMSNFIGLKGHQLDGPGKVMALKGYGEPFMSYKNYDLKSLEKLWTRNNFDSKKISMRNNFQEICNHIRYCHHHTEKAYVEHFKEYSDPNEIIVYSGGVAQNTIVNSEIKKNRPNLHIPPHCNDEGLSLGIVEFLRIYHDQEPFDNSGFPYWQSDEAPNSEPSDRTIKKIAELLASRKIVGWYQGKGEVGPRALGNRSILMDPTIYDGKDTLNKKVKNREFFRPFGASILEDKKEEYFKCDYNSPYMLYVIEILDKVSFPAITHIDGTCRIQTVSPSLSQYHSLISEFENITGVPMLLNTSLNKGGKPICGSVIEAIDLFSRKDLDVLVVGDEIYEK